MEFFNYLRKNIDNYDRTHKDCFQEVLTNLTVRKEKILNNLLSVLINEVIYKSNDDNVTYNTKDSNFYLDLNFLGINAKFVLTENIKYIILNEEESLEYSRIFNKVDLYLNNNVNFNITNSKLVYNLLLNFYLNNHIEFGYTFCYFLFEVFNKQNFINSGYITLIEYQYSQMISLKIPILSLKPTQFKILISIQNRNFFDFSMYLNKELKDEKFFETEDFKNLVKYLFQSNIFKNIKGE